MFGKIKWGNISKGNWAAALLVGLVLGLGAFAPISTSASPLSEATSDLDHLKMLSGQEFEIDFMSMMIEHHQMAVQMAQLLPDRATHAELKTLGQNIISSQSVEVREFEGWLKTWYNIDAASTSGAMGGATPPDQMGGTMSGGSSSGTVAVMPRSGAGDTSSSILTVVLLALAAVAAGGTLLVSSARLRKRT